MYSLENPFTFRTNKFLGLKMAISLAAILKMLLQTE
jgi:hypothetical protein